MENHPIRGHSWASRDAHAEAVESVVLAEFLPFQDLPTVKGIADDGGARWPVRIHAAGAEGGGDSFMNRSRRLLRQTRTVLPSWAMTPTVR